MALAVTTIGLRGVALAAALLLAGCGRSDVAPIRIVGSSTVYPFTTTVVEQFKRTYPAQPAPIVESTGTGGGIKLFCGGAGARYPEIANASRRITKGEIKDCAAHGVGDVVEIQIGLDGLVIAQARGGPLPSLTQRDVYLALAAEPFGRGANKAVTWRDVNPALPAVRIEVIGPPPTSGTRDSFDELYMVAGCATEPAMKALKAADPLKYKRICSKVREDGLYVEGGESDNLIVQKVAASRNAIGVFGYSYLEQNLDVISDVPLAGVSATYDNIASGRYPASRPMFLYVKAAPATAALRAFLAEYSREATWGRGGTLSKKGLVPSADAERARYAQVAAALTPLDRATL